MKLDKLALGMTLALSVTVSAVTGCAGDRPMRNGVPNENLFLRKAFIIRPGAAGTPEAPAEDDGWVLKATVVQTLTPNPLAASVLFNGAENGGMLVRFIATQDQLQLVNLREISGKAIVKEQETRTPEVINAWPAEHGDLKLAVNSDGEKTNRLEWNQELDWRQRAWVKANLARGDLGDFALFGSQMSYRLGKCAGGGSVTVEPGSILVDEDNDYIEWKTKVTVPVNIADKACVESYGDTGTNFIRLGRQNVTATVKYSMVRAKPRSEITYKPLELAEKDPIRRKYGPILQQNFARDPETGKLAGRELAIRFDPKKDVVFYFAKGYPEEKKGYFTAPGGIVDQTNALFEKAGAPIRLVVKNYDQDLPPKPDNLMKERGREYGDVRFNFIRWNSDEDSGSPFLGITQFVPDPRTGEAISASINIADAPLKEFVGDRVDAFLHTIMCRAAAHGELDGVPQIVCDGMNSGKPWGPPAREVKGPDGKYHLEMLPETCTTGQIAELLPGRLDATYGQSSLFGKMQEYLGEPASKFGPLGPRDFVPAQDADFHEVYRKILPYYIFADPATNPFVTPISDGGEFGPGAQFEALTREVEFHELAGKIDRGEDPFPTNGAPGFIPAAETFVDRMKALQVSHRDYLYQRSFMHKATAKLDEANDLISFTSVMEKAGRRCVDGRWETREEWLEKLVQTYHALTVWHEFGHALGLDHNFMGSVDKANFPHYKAEGCDPNTDPKKCDRIGMYSSSVMEYASTPDRIFWANESGGPGWAPYDRAAITWLYANEASPSTEAWQAAKDELAKRQPEGVSGQLSSTLPWKDPEGFGDDGKERHFLYCNATHLRFTPFCRQNDVGSTPSEIIANEIEAYEWQYAWRNFRKSRKVWDIHDYADIPAKEIIELRRFLPVWRQDWQAKNLRDDFGRMKLPLPSDANAVEAYYGQLTRKFDDEMSQTNQMVAAFHLALIQQSSGERPYKTIIDKYHGDVTQQGISLDKQFAMQGWVGLWPQDNYDPNQRGAFVSSYGTEFDPEFGALAEKAVAAMIGEERFDAYPYLSIAAVVLYAKDTHNPAFDGKNMLKDWIGGLVFSRREQIFDYFRDLALRNDRYPELGCAVGMKRMPDGTLQRIDVPTLATCEYNPMLPRGTTNNEHLSDEWNEFIGPDDHQYAWIYIRDRNQWAFVDKSRNTASYKVFRDYNEQITYKHVETDEVHTWLLPVKVTMDAYLKYNNGEATGQ